MKRTKSVFLFALLATVVFMPIKNSVVFAKENSGVIVDVLEENNNLFNEEIIWNPGNLEESSIKISNNLEKDIVIKNLRFHDEELLDYLSSSYIDEDHERYKHFVESATIRVKDNDNEIFNGTLKNVFLEENIQLEKELIVKANESKNIELEINISEDLDDRGQGIQHKFSISVQYEYDINSGEEDLPNTGGLSSKNFMFFGIIALGIGASILKLPQKKEEI